MAVVSEIPAERHAAFDRRQRAILSRIGSQFVIVFTIRLASSVLFESGMSNLQAVQVQRLKVGLDQQSESTAPRKKLRADQASSSPARSHVMCRSKPPMTRTTFLGAVRRRRCGGRRPAMACAALAAKIGAWPPTAPDEGHWQRRAAALVGY